MKKRITTFCLAASLISLSSPANASVVLGEVTGGNSGGIFEEVTPAPGFTVGNNNQESPNLFALNEAQGATLLADIAGITAGTKVDSHYVWFDPAAFTTVIGSITFDEEILAIIIGSTNLFATDYLGNPNVTYVGTNLRGLESGDSASFSGDTLTVNLTAGSPGDYIRVLTRGEINSAVPEPSSWALMLLGFFGIGAAMRRRTPRAVSDRQSLAR